MNTERTAPERQRLRDRAVAAFRAGVAAAEPGSAVARALDARPVSQDRRVHVLAVGKAARPMARAALEALSPGQIASAIAVTNYENAAPLDGCEVIAAGHPVPDENGLKAGRAVIAALERAGAGELVLALISGGASALLPAPVEGLSLGDKIAVNEALLTSGADITQMNLVRQALSRLKGGGALRLAAPAEVRSLILSDVLGDDLRVIGSGPTVGPIGTHAEARALLRKLELWDGLPDAVRAALSTSPDLQPLPDADATLIGSNRQSLGAMAEAAGAQVSEEPLVGDVAAAAERVVAEALRLPPGAALAFGGETTVKLTGKGRGGRNQELALRVALLMEDAGMEGPWAFLSGGTDGRDGPTDAAGGLVDPGTLARAGAAGLDIRARLAENDSHAALEAAGDLLITGATGTNVADLQLFLRG